MKTPSLNFHFEIDNYFKKFCHFFLSIFRVKTHLPTERHVLINHTVRVTHQGRRFKKFQPTSTGACCLRNLMLLQNLRVLMKN